LLTVERPTSHKEVLNSSNCINFKTVNGFIVGNFNNTGKSYIAIENEQNIPVLAKLTTETDLF
jgi:hypothetical protein